MSKTRVFIYGSCVSRDTFEHFDPEQFELVQYVARQSALSATTRPVELMAPPTLESRFQQRMIAGDFGSSLRRMLPDFAEHVDVLLVDLTDERLGVYLLPDGTVLTRSVELIQSGAENHLPQGTRHLPFGTQQHFEYWQGAIRALGESIRSMMPHVGIALLDIPWAEWSESGQPTPDSFGVSAAQANPVFRPYVEAAAQALGAHVISVDPSTVASGPHHPWGDAPFHYAERVYLDVVRQLTGIEGRVVWGPEAQPATGGHRMASADVPVANPAGPQTGSRAAVPAHTAQGTGGSGVASKPKSTAVVKATIADGAAGVAAQIEQNGTLPKFIHIDTLDAAPKDKNLMVAARKDPRARDTLNYLVNNGFYIYKAGGTETRLVQHGEVRRLWQAVKDGKFKITDDNIVYTYTPATGGTTTQIVVVFSPMSSNPLETSINRHFTQTYPSLQKQLIPGTGVLRIADLGGVKGAFYLNTTYLPDNADRITRFIAEFVNEQGIGSPRVVLYGPSKGATGAVYHGLRGGWNFVAADPVLGDALYVEKYADIHFTTGGIFPETKESVFGRAVYEAAGRSYPDWMTPIVVCSHRSPQFDVISKTLDPLSRWITLLNSDNPLIKDHPDVPRQTLQHQVTSINLLLSGFGLPAGMHDVV
ncbi:XcbB/CpsF family capsular polysaccharide biosynthesis protein [Promicromonospora sukumoe]|uniref:XcbB/CpsF family capsular polysaccharide biosynthesis protein n=1 Tax=Promicromonospora sukumoe TaxID=88382 RepID=UPI0012F9F81B|nr:XcbB/CpsF family capsular polysaccharide biosynthesis protein [Promicromonospora sukumoe]